MRLSVLSRTLVGVAACSMTAPVWAAVAQETSQTDDGTAQSLNGATPRANESGGVGEIIVTARKVAESAQDVPLAINVIGGDEIAERGIVNVQALQGQLPSIAIGEVNGIAQITSRGLGNDNFLAGSDPSVGLNVDGVVISQPGAQLGAFFDLERVEVVRGPQGTLYGRNTTGGAINLVTNKPTATFQGYGRVSYGNYNTLLLEGALSGPIIGDTVQARLAFKTEDHDGYGKNVHTGRDIDDAKRRAVRASVTILPSDRLTISLMGEYTSEHDANYQIKYSANSFANQTPTGIAAGSFFASDPRDLNTELEPRNDRHSSSLIGTVEFHANDWLTLKSISGYRRFATIGARDYDGTAAAIAGAYNTLGTKQYTQEFQALVQTDRIEAVLGAFYYKENLKSTLLIGNDIYGPPLKLLIRQLGKVDTESVAGFANVTYNLTDQFSVDLGGRWSWERREGDAQFYLNGNHIPGGQTAGSFRDFTPRVGLQFKPSEDVLFYASYSEGFKSGVIASGTVTPILRPERVTAYEAGIKSTLFDRTVQANLSLYRYRIKDLQVSRTEPGPTPGTSVQIFENAADALAQGVELDLVWQPTRNFKLAANGGYSDATFTEFFSLNPLDGPTGIFENQKGNRLVQTPEWSGTLNAEYKWFLDPGTVALSGQAQYQSRVWFSPFNDLATSQKPVTRYDATLRFDSQNDSWYASVWMRNITNERVATTKFAISSGLFISGQYAPPRTYGATVGYKF